MANKIHKQNHESKQIGHRLLVDDTVKANEDDFNHEVYADLLGEIFEPDVNKPGISVGLFGKWGQGKSSVVNMLIDNMQHKYGEKIGVVWFNAWESRGDSVRRQLLLSILETISPQTAKKLKKEAGLDALPEMTATRPEKVMTVLKFFWYTLKRLFWVPVVAAALILILMWLINLSWQNETRQDTIMGVAQVVVAILGAVVVFTRTHVQRVASIYLGSDQSIKSHAIRYPEQFVQYFRICAARFCKGGTKEILVVVDDIDRCEPKTVTEALAAIRQLGDCRKRTTKENSKPIVCRFLVPCDEKQVVLALEADGHDAGDEGGRYHDYQSEELLRKFFDVTIRMDKLLPTDLTHYSEKLAEEIGIKDIGAIRHLVHAVSPTNPRQVKKLINAYKNAVRRVEISRTKRHLPEKDDELPSLTMTLVAIVALRETYPCIYEDAIAESPENMTVIRKGTREGFKQLEFVSNKAEKIQERILTSLAEASKMLKSLPSFDPNTAELLIHGQAEEGLRGVPKQGQIYRAFRKSDADWLMGALPEDKHAKNQVFKWLGEKVEFGRSITEIRHVIGLILDCQKQEGGISAYTGKILQHLLTNSQYRKATMKDYERIDELAEGILHLPARDQSGLLRLIDIKNPPGKEVTLYFNLGNRLPDNLKTAFINQLNDIVCQHLDEAETEEKSTENEENIIEVLYDLLPEDIDNMRGLAPAIGEKILTSGWNPCEYVTDEKEEKTSNLQAELGMILLGNSKEEAQSVLSEILGSKGWHTVIEFGEENEVNSAWSSIVDLLNIIPREQVSGFFPAVTNWLSGLDADRTRRLTEKFGSLISGLGHEQLKQLAEILVSQSDEFTWIVKLANQNTSTTLQPFRKQVFLQVTSKCENMSTVTDDIQRAFTLIHDTNWDVKSIADKFLAHRLSLGPGRAGLPEWIPLLKPLLGRRKSAQTTNAVLETLPHWLHGALSVGLEVVWRSCIAKKDAQLIASATLNTPPNKRQVNETRFFVKLPKKRGARHVLGQLIHLLSQKAPSFYQTNQDLMKYIARHCPEEERENFEHLLEGMTQNEDINIKIAGLELLADCPALTTEAQGFLKELKNLQINPRMREALDKCLDKHNLS